MTSLTVRSLEWSFDASTPFQWNPGNPAFGLGMNSLSFIGPAFERFVVLATKKAMRVIEDPEVLSEADAFLRQEGLHARAHRIHVAALTEQYPGLAEVSRELDRRFDELLANEPLEFQLAYTANIEATFTPLFDTFLRRAPTFFDNGDPSVAALFLWHLVEEIEHRSSALIVYDAVVKNPWYRLRRVPQVFSHMLECVNVCGRGFNRNVPKEERRIDALEDASLSPIRLVRRMLTGKAEEETEPQQFSAISARESVFLIYRLLRSQMPGHSPVHERTPPIAHEWIAEYRGGRDVVHWYSH